MKKTIVFTLFLLCCSCNGSKDEPPDPPLFECDCGDTEKTILMWGVWGASGKSGVWTYPIIPGMEEWQQLKTNEEYLNASQIPEEVLASLSTEDLIDLCLRYPGIVNVFIPSNISFGFENMLREFNGIRELYSRGTEEVASSLAERYLQRVHCLCLLKDMDFEEIVITFYVPMRSLEIFSSRLELRENESNEILKEILKALVYGYEEKCKYPNLSEKSNLTYNLYARAHLISQICKQCTNSLVSISGYLRFTSEQIDVINELSYQLIN